MTDAELDYYCREKKSCNKFALDPKMILEGGKMEALQRLLPEMKARGDRVLIFSQVSPLSLHIPAPFI